MSISAERMPLSSFLRYVSDRTGVSVIAEERLDDKEITLDMKDQDVGLVLSVVARRLGAQVTRSGNMYYIGQLRNEDRGVLVRKVRRLNADELGSAVAVLLSENGRAVTYEDGLVVIGDRVEVLERVAELLDGIEEAPSNSWVVQLHLVSMADTFFFDAGIEVNPSAEISAVFAGMDPGDSSSQVAANATLQAILSADRQDDSVSIVTEPSFVLIDGTEAKFRDATQTPVRIRTVSPEGTVTDAGFERVQTGTEIVCGIRELGTNRARLSVSITNSSVAGAVEDIPIVDEQVFSTEASVQASGVYLLGSFTRSREASQIRTITATAQRRERDSRTLYVWARTYRIAGPVETQALPPLPSPSASQPRPLAQPGGPRTVDEGEGRATPSPEAERLRSGPDQTPQGSHTDRQDSGQQPPRPTTETPFMWWGVHKDFYTGPFFSDPLQTPQNEPKL